MDSIEKNVINKFLISINRNDLICEYLYSRSYDEVMNILKMPEWKDKKFEGLLTSGIWNSNSTEIKEILKMPEWQNEKFEGLLTSSIWNRCIYK